jgi:hypothetical protein
VPVGLHTELLASITRERLFAHWLACSVIAHNNSPIMSVQYTDKIAGTTTVISNTVISGLNRLQNEDADVFVIHQHESMSAGTTAVTCAYGEILVI